MDPLRNVVRARTAGTQHWRIGPTRDTCSACCTQLRKHVLLRPYFHEAELRAAKMSRSATVDRAEHAAVRALRGAARRR